MSEIRIESGLWCTETQNSKKNEGTKQLTLASGGQLLYIATNKDKVYQTLSRLTITGSWAGPGNEASM